MTDLTLTDDQRKFTNRIKQHRARGIGYGGTGKSVCLAQAAIELQQAGVKVTLASPTNKACAVLRKRVPQSIPVMTLHSLTTKPAEVDDIDEETGQVVGKKMVFSPKPDRVEGHVLIDEGSMVGKGFFGRISHSFESYSIIGDPFQLPPVRDHQLLTEENASAALTKVMRQAMDSPALVWATGLRDGRTKAPEGVEVVHGIIKSHLAEMAEPEAICITFTNSDRHWLNNEIRKTRWGSNTRWLPEIGDKVISRETMRDVGVFNGQPGTVKEILEVTDTQVQVMVAWESLEEAPMRHWIDKRRLMGRDVPFDDKFGSAIDYGYAVTCHSAQGSGWPRVFIVPSKTKLLKHQGRQGMLRWLYTAATRVEGAGKLTVIDT